MNRGYASSFRRKRTEEKRGKSDVDVKIGGTMIKGLRTLNDVMEISPSSFTQGRVSVVGQSITRITLLPPAYRRVRVIYLSRNRLENLHGIAQFKHLETVSASDNFLSDYDAISDLRKLSRLRNLSLEGNPITRRPHYRHHVIYLVPQLDILDKRQVTKEERECSVAIVKREESKLLECFRRDCELVKLKLCEKLLRVHGELRELAYGRPGVMSRYAIPPDPVFRLDTFMKLWRYDATCSRREIRRVRDVIVVNVTRIWSSLQLKRIRQNRYGEDDSWNEAYASMSSIQNDKYVRTHARVETLALGLERRHLRLVSLHKNRIVKRNNNIVSLKNQQHGLSSWCGVGGVKKNDLMKKKKKKRGGEKNGFMNNNKKHQETHVVVEEMRKNKSIRYQREVLSNLNNRRTTRRKRQELQSNNDNKNKELEENLQLAQQVLRVRLEVEKKLKDANRVLRSRIETMNKLLQEKDARIEEYKMRDVKRQRHVQELELLVETWKDKEIIGEEKLKDLEMKMRIESDKRVSEMRESMSVRTKKLASKFMNRFSRHSILRNTFSRLQEFARKKIKARILAKHVLWSYVRKSEFQIKRRALVIWRERTVLSRKIMERVLKRMYCIWKRLNLRDAMSRLCVYHRREERENPRMFDQMKLNLMSYCEKNREKYFLRRCFVSWRVLASRSSLARKHRKMQLEKYESEEKLRARLEIERREMIDEMSSSIHDIASVANRSILYEENEAAARLALKRAREEYTSLESKMLLKDESHRKQSLKMNTRIESLSQMLEKQERRMKYIEGTLEQQQQSNDGAGKKDQEVDSTMMLSFGVDMEEEQSRQNYDDESISGIAEMARATASQLANAIEYWGKDEREEQDQGEYKSVVDEISTLEKKLLRKLSRSTN